MVAVAREGERSVARRGLDEEVGIGLKRFLVDGPRVGFAEEPRDLTGLRWPSGCAGGVGMARRFAIMDIGRVWISDLDG